MRNLASSVEAKSTPRKKNSPSRHRRRRFHRTPSRQVLNALLLQGHIDALQADLNQPEGLRMNSAILELVRLAPSAARILQTIEDLLETSPSTLRAELQEAHDSAWAALEFGLEQTERRAA